MAKETNKKMINNLKFYGGAVLLTGGIIAGTVLINEKNTNHCESICLMTQLFGVNHQIDKIKDENNCVIPVYNDEKTFHVEHKYKTGTKTVDYETYIEEEVTVYEYDEKGNVIGTTEEYKLIPITGQKMEPIYEIEQFDIPVKADDSEIKLYDQSTNKVKTLKLN